MRKGVRDQKNILCNKKRKNDPLSDHIYLDKNCWVHCFSQGAKKALFF